MEYYVTKPADYWIAQNAVNITLNALGNPNRTQGSVASGAAILCYIEGVDGLGYDNGHRFKTWPLTISPTYFNSNTAKYVYVAIPRTSSVGTQAVVVFPSEKLDIYGVNESDAQIGSTDYYYIWLQGILTATDGTSNREWQQGIDFGKKGTDEDLYDDTSSDWYQYSKVNEVVTFLKNIAMKAGTTFQNLILGYKELTGVATSNTAYTDSDALVATPGYVESQYLSKTHESTAQEQVGFLKGLWVKAKNLFGIDANGNAKLNSVTSDDIHSDGYNDDNIGGEGYHVYKDVNGQGHVCTDFLDVRLKARFTELEIRRLSYVNADQVQSMAASKVEKVLPIGADGNVLTGSYSSSAIIAYRCLAVADDGSTATKNGWHLGDQARCQTFNITAPGNYTDVTNRLYWRLVVRIGQCSANGVILDTESSSSSDSSDDGDSKVYHFFDLANIADIAANDGAEFNEFFADPLTTGDAYHGYATQWTETTGSSNPVIVNSGNDAPAADDAVVQMGSQTDETRMGFFITKADGLNTGPYIYAGVNNFSLAGKMITKISPAEVLISARKLRVFVDPTAGSYEPLVIYRGDWLPGSTSYYYDEWDFQGSRWLCLYQGAEGTTEAPGTTPANWKEISLKGKDAIDGYFDYFHGVDYDGNTRPTIASASNLGKVDLLDYGSTAEDMIDIVEEYGGSYSWEAYGVELGSRYMRRGGDYAVYVATASGWVREGKNGADGTSPWFADIDNEMDSIACDADGHPVQINSNDQSVQTVVSMWHGSQKQSSTIEVFDDNTSDYEYTSEAKHNGITVTWDNSTGLVTILFDSGNTVTFNGKKVFCLRLTSGTEVRTLYFTVNGILPGEDGQPATVYNLMPSLSEISVGRTASGDYSPVKNSIYCGYKKSVGGTITSVADATGTIDSKYRIFFRRRSREDGWESSYYYYNNINYRRYLVIVSGRVSGLDASVYDMVEFILYDNTSDAIISTSDIITTKIIDKETVPVIADGSDGTDGSNGTDGTSPIVADLDNEMDSVACDAGGHPASLQEVSTKVSLYKGSTPIAINSIAVKDASGSTEASMTSGSPLNGVTPTFTAAPDSDTAQAISFSFATGSGTSFVNDKRVFRIIIGNSTENVSRDLYFTVNGVRPGANGEAAVLYNLLPSVNAISFGEGSLEQSFYMQVLKTEGDSSNTIAMNTLSGMEVHYSTNTLPDESNPQTQWGTVEQGVSGIGFSGTANNTATIQPDVEFNQIYLALFKTAGSGNNKTYTLIDRETIPIVRDGAKGTDGKDGKDGSDGKDGTNGTDGKDGEDAYLIVANPQYAIFEERLDGSNKVVDTSGFSGTLQVLKGGSAAQFKITAVQTSNCSNNGTESSNTAISSATVAFQNITSGASSGYLQFTVSTVDGKFQGTIKVPFYVNLLATWEREVIDGTEEVVASKMGFTDNGSTVTQLSWIGNYIRGWAENTSRLTETVGSTNYGNNLFGFSKGVTFGGAVPFVQGYGIVSNTGANGGQMGLGNLGFDGKTGYYVVTCEARMLSAARNITFAFWAGGDCTKTENIGTSWTKLTMIFNLTGFVSDNPSSQQIMRAGYFYTDGVISNGNWTSPVTDSNRLAIRYLQIEHGSVPSLFGICADDAANNSEPMHVTWNQSPSSGMFSDETSGNYGPGGTSNYTTNDVYPKSNPQYPAGTGYIELIKGDLVMTEGVYTLSFWARANANGSVMECFCYDATNTETYKGVVAYCDGLGTYYGELDPNQTEGMSYWGSTRIKLTTAWKKYYVHWYMTGASSKISVIPIRINGADTEGAPIDYYIAQIKLERGYVTSANRTVYETVMKQTARRMDFSVLVNSMEKAGIHLYTESNCTPDNEAELAKGFIDLVAGKVKFKNAAGTVDDKVWIDTTSGTLHAVNGDFSGTMTAAGGSMYFGKDGSWTGMATVDSVVGGFADLVTVGMRNDGVGEEKTGRIVLKTAKKKDGVLRLSSMLKIENNGGLAGQSASGGNDGYKLTFTNILEASGKEDKIILDGGDGSGTFAGGVSAGTVEANYILAKAGYKIQTADILTVSSSGSISASYQMIIVNTDSDITLTLSSDGASAGQLMIIKKTTNNGWVTVENSVGTQIGKFNCGSLVCVYNNGWK